MPLGHLHDHWPEAGIQRQCGGWERGHLPQDLPKFRPGLQSLFTDEILRGTIESTLLSGPGLGAQTSHRIYKIFPKFKFIQLNMDHRHHISARVKRYKNLIFMLLKIKPLGIGSVGTDFLLGKSIYPSQVEPCPGKHQLSNIPTSQLPLVSRTGRVTEEVQGPKVKVTRGKACLRQDTISTM